MSDTPTRYRVTAETDPAEEPLELASGTAFEAALSLIDQCDLSELRGLRPPLERAVRRLEAGAAGQLRLVPRDDDHELGGEG